MNRDKIIRNLKWLVGTAIVTEHSDHLVIRVPLWMINANRELEIPDAVIEPLSTWEHFQLMFLLLSGVHWVKVE